MLEAYKNSTSLPAAANSLPLGAVLAATETQQPIESRFSLGAATASSTPAASAAPTTAPAAAEFFQWVSFYFLSIHSGQLCTHRLTYAQGRFRKRSIPTCFYLGLTISCSL